MSGDELALKRLEIKRKYGILDDYTYEVERALLIPDEVERRVATLDIDIRYGTKDPFEGDKEIATIKGEPWIRVVNDGFNDEGEYFFEFDWNTIWIEQLKERGYAGPTDESIIDAWFDELCRQHASASLGAPPINGGIVRG